MGSLSISRGTCNSSFSFSRTTVNLKKSDVHFFTSHKHLFYLRECNCERSKAFSFITVGCGVGFGIMAFMSAFLRSQLDMIQVFS